MKHLKALALLSTVLLVACAPLAPETGMSLKEFSRKSALSMRGNLVPAGKYEDVDVYRYETSIQRLQRSRKDEPPESGWQYYYVKNGVMISKADVVALQNNEQRRLTEFKQQQTKKTTVTQNKNEIAEKTKTSRRVADSKKMDSDTLSFICKPVFLRVTNKEGKQILAQDNSNGNPIRLTIKNGYLQANDPANPNLVLSMTGARFKSENERLTENEKTKIFMYERLYDYKGDQSIIQLSLNFSNSKNYVLMTDVSTSRLAPNVLSQLWRCER
jgi:hypothetical protein